MKLTRVSLVGLAVISFGFFAQIAHSQTYIQPGATAPDGPIAPPLNASNTAQQKAGTLVVGNGTDKLCLNAEAATGTGDTTNCISAWTDIGSSLAGRYVLLNQSGIGNALLAGSYPKQLGFIRIQATDTDPANPASQNFSSLVTAPHVCLERFQGSGLVAPCNQGGGGGLQSLGCFCYGSDNACTTNAECVEGVSLQPATTRAVYATDGGLGTNDAGVFGGKIYVFGANYDHIGGGNRQGQICLNGTAPANCVSSWDQVANLSSAYVKLQPYVVGQPASPTEKQLGGAAIQASSGVINGLTHTASIVAGDPSSVGTVSCSGSPCICGNGQCATSHETTANCAIDCAVVNPVRNFQLLTQDNAAEFSIEMNSQSPAGNVQLLLTRTENADSTFVPQTGRTYITGMTIGDTRIIYAGSVPQNGYPTVPGDTSIIGGRTYYYKAYQANQFPRYSNPLTQTLDPVFLTVSKMGGGSGGFFGEINGFLCSTGCSNKQILYSRGAQETMTVFVGGGGRFLGWSGACSGSGGCTVNMNFDQILTASFR